MEISMSLIFISLEDNTMHNIYNTRSLHTPNNTTTADKANCSLFKKSNNKLGIPNNLLFYLHCSTVDCTTLK